MRNTPGSDGMTPNERALVEAENAPDYLSPARRAIAQLSERDRLQLVAEIVAGLPGDIAAVYIGVSAEAVAFLVDHGATHDEPSIFEVEPLSMIDAVSLTIRNGDRSMNFSAQLPARPATDAEVERIKGI